MKNSHLLLKIAATALTGVASGAMATHVHKISRGNHSPDLADIEFGIEAGFALLYSINPTVRELANRQAYQNRMEAKQPKPDTRTIEERIAQAKPIKRVKVKNEEKV